MENENEHYAKETKSQTDREIEADGWRNGKRANKGACKRVRISQPQKVVSTQCMSNGKRPANENLSGLNLEGSVNQRKCKLISHFPSQ